MVKKRLALSTDTFRTSQKVYDAICTTAGLCSSNPTASKWSPAAQNNSVRVGYMAALERLLVEGKPGEADAIWKGQLFDHSHSFIFRCNKEGMDQTW